MHAARYALAMSDGSTDVGRRPVVPDASGLREIARRIAPYIHRTPLWRSDTLSRMTGLEVYLKAELFQKTGSYKPRGMLWALMSMTAEQRERGVITFSAGNAAQGIAYAGAILGAPVTVTMPAAASPTKAQATRDYGAQVILHGTPKECLAHSRRIAAERGLTFVSSYDDEALMQGHATLGLEILDDVPDASAVFVGVGGGGMLGGITFALQARSSIAELIGVEPEGAAAMRQSLEAGRAVTLASVDTIADGLAAPGVGELCFAVVRDRVFEVRVVSDEQIVDAMKLLMSRCKMYVEPAGAAALAGLLHSGGRLPEGAKVVCVVSGGNLDFQQLRAML